MTAQGIDHVALLPAYLAAATAVLVLLADLVFGRLGGVLAVATAGAAAVSMSAAYLAGAPPRETFCVDVGCSYTTGSAASGVAIVMCALFLAVLGLSAATLRAEDTPSAEYVFLLACSLTGGVVLAHASDLITIIVALETLTLPLYVLVAARRRSRRAAEAAVNFLLVSVAASAVTLFGAALLYAATGAVHLSALAAGLGSPRALHVIAVAMIVAGLVFKVAAVPLHGWAPGTYDGAPLPIAAYLSTVSKLGGVVALLWITSDGLGASLRSVAGTLLAVVAVVTMTVGNLVALRQKRAVRLLAWSSIAQAGYLLAPFAALGMVSGDSLAALSGAILGFAVFYVLLEVTAFGAVTALRGGRADGGALTDYTGAARRNPWLGGVLILALIGLAGLPPGMAGLFAKVTVVSVIAAPAPMVAVAVAVNAVLGLMYYLRFARLTLAPGGSVAYPSPWPVTLTVAFTAACVVAVGFLPQFVLDLVAVAP